MITIDGSQGEGGGQIVRTALGLSLVTGKPFSIENIRAKRRKPGLMRQHLTALIAAAEIGRAHVTGNAPGSKAFTFTPRDIRPGSYRFSIGTAGSCTLVLQTILPALMVANGPSNIVLEGGTHNPFAPPFDFLEYAFLPLVNRMGPKITVTLERPGFYPAGGGRMHVAVEPFASLKSLDLNDRGAKVKQSARSYVSNLPASIAQRELAVVGDKLNVSKEDLHVVEIRKAAGPGNALAIIMENEQVTEVFTGFGEYGVPAERVAKNCVKEAREYMASSAAVGRHLADQLLVPMAMAGSGQFTTLAPSSHTLTNADIIQRFLDVNVSISKKAEVYRCHLCKKALYDQII